MSTRINITVDSGGLLERNRQQVEANRLSFLTDAAREDAAQEGVDRLNQDLIAAGIDPETRRPLDTSAIDPRPNFEEPGAYRRDGIAWLLPTNFEFNPARLECRTKGIKNRGLFPVWRFADPFPSAEAVFELINGGIVAFQKGDSGLGEFRREAGSGRVKLSLSGNATSLEYATFLFDGTTATPDIYSGNTGVLSEDYLFKLSDFKRFSLETIVQSGIGTSEAGNPSIRLELTLDEVEEDGTTSIDTNKSGSIRLLVAGAGVLADLRYAGDGGGGIRDSVGFSGPVGTQGKKQHVKIAFANNRMRVYVDGNLVADEAGLDDPFLKPDKKYRATLELAYTHRRALIAVPGPVVDFALLYGARFLTGGAVTAPSESFDPPEKLVTFR